MGKPYLYEFLFRGRPDGNGDFHVVLAVDTELPHPAGAIATNQSEAMTPAQAEEAGYDLPKILDGFDKTLHAEVMALRTENEELASRLESEKGEHSGTRAQLAQAVRDRDGMAAKLVATAQQISEAVAAEKARAGDRIQTNRIVPRKPRRGTG